MEGVWSPSLIGWIDYKSITLEHGKICLESNNQGQTHKSKTKEGIPPKKVEDKEEDQNKRKKRPQLQTEAH